MGYKYERAHTQGWCVTCRQRIKKGDKISRLIAKWVHIDCKMRYLRKVAELEEAGKL